MRPDVEYFLKKSKLGSMSHKFFSLAKEGGYSVGEDSWEFGKDVKTEGLTLNFDRKVCIEYVDKWEKLKPELSGAYLEIANITTDFLNEILDLDEKKKR